VSCTFEGWGADDFGKKCFGCRVSVEDTVFSSFLIIDDKLEGNPGLLGPLRMRRFLAVAKHVAGIIFHVISKK
jgi:hypothetical protein